MDTSIRQGDFLFTDNTVIVYLQNYRLTGYIKNRSNSIVPLGNRNFQFRKPLFINFIVDVAYIVPVQY
ncbi:MAG: hypothetical protein BWY31_03763 [Lentisphaerae bacterium ADurb.Bin242]|nr:MAG: hypothetical protein BWY31_03763 [Lentisphaerae bacterium ADurb.Bin242]